jgi:YfiH family protein
MEAATGLSLPRLSRGRFSYPGSESLPEMAFFAYTDEALFRACGVRIAFTERSGGVSDGPYDSFDLATHVDDDPQAVARNREALAMGLGFPGIPLIVPNQVHGGTVVSIDDASDASVAEARTAALDGADALVIACDDVAGLLCYADCMPVVIVAPDGCSAIVHCGWRGVIAHIAVSSLDRVCSLSGCDPRDCNVYIGPFIHVECFEVGEDVARRFSDTFGSVCTPDAHHVDLGAAVRIDLRAAGIVDKRIADVGACTVCVHDRFYSYRAQQGVCGRHGAYAVRHGIR